MSYRNRIVGHGEEDPEQLAANPKNWRIHSAYQEAVLKGGLRRIGWVKSVTVNQRTGFVVDGHLRVAHAISTSEPSVPVEYIDVSEEEEGEILVELDPIVALAGTDQPKLDELIAGIRSDDESLSEFLESMRGHIAEVEQGVAPAPSLSERFVVPPFSVLDARQGYWQERKRQWLSLGIQSELGRGDSPRSSTSAAPGEEPTYRQIGSGNGLLGETEQARSHYRAANATPGGRPLPAASLGADGKTVRGDGRGRKLADGRSPGRLYGQDLMRGEHEVGRKPDSRAIKDHQARLTWVAGRRSDDELDEVSRKILAAQPQSGTSIFDPVLCELVYRWFCPPAGHVLDPMAGGSVRGIVASLLGRKYTGIELRGEQVEANRGQLHIADAASTPGWIEGDALDVATLAPGEYDLLFSCPPYADLERYSDDPRDLSTMGYDKFLETYAEIIRACSAQLRDNRFACFVVGDVRDERGCYRNFVSDTIAVFKDAGLALYNEAILVTAVGSLPIRVGKQFSSSRKLGKTHQNVLVFVKGDPRLATEACGEVEVSMPLDVIRDDDGD